MFDLALSAFTYTPKVSVALLMVILIVLVIVFSVKASHDRKQLENLHSGTTDYQSVHGNYVLMVILSIISAILLVPLLVGLVAYLYLKLTGK